jgi:hypothetical protein
MVRFQATHCETAKERALMMFDALAELKGCTPELQFLCNEANQLLIN